MDTSEDIMLGVLGESARQRVKAVIERVVDYIRRRYPLWDCPEEDLRGWLAWHWCNGLVAVIEDPASGELAALLVARYLDDPLGYETDYQHRPGAPICHVELAIAESTSALCVVCRMIEARHGAPQRIVFERGTRGPRVHVFKQFMEKLNHGKSESSKST